tara:strand:- start:352 stop:651 length:300 start_codon:yes stop_codon:yes gene_type:complete
MTSTALDAVGLLKDKLAMIAPASIKYVYYEPADVPGHESDIAKAVGCSSNQTQNLLWAVEHLEDDGHYDVSDPKVERDLQYGPQGEVIPAQFSRVIRQG